ncbi:hypothetical protein [Rhizobium paknamense]|uniref:Uncharacterized protein n=1 Tax=Rhizobium paknamense TaxID=1206817 RepID=A0ABU0IHJ2_9HYPH|nr:hypothetical protein [Rhizobium paknamense]MDQ0457646.1 hypothetical protein [Rhizobium paknamense]
MDQYMCKVIYLKGRPAGVTDIPLEPTLEAFREVVDCLEYVRSHFVEIFSQLEELKSALALLQPSTPESTRPMIESGFE